MKWTKTNMDELLAMCVFSSNCSANKSLLDSLINKVTSIFADLSVNYLWNSIICQGDITNLAADSPNIVLHRTIAAGRISSSAMV